MIFWDSTALVALLVREPDSKRRLDQLKRDPEMVVWWGTFIECESALQRRMREGAISPSDVRSVRSKLSRLSDSWYEVQPVTSLRNLAIRILRTHPLRSADAIQLAAALSVASVKASDFWFASADERLNAAAEIEDLSVLE